MKILYLFLISILLLSACSTTTKTHSDADDLIEAMFKAIEKEEYITATVSQQVSTSNQTTSETTVKKIDLVKSLFKITTTPEINPNNQQILYVTTDYAIHIKDFKRTESSDSNWPTVFEDNKHIDYLELVPNTKYYEWKIISMTNTTYEAQLENRNLLHVNLTIDRKTLLPLQLYKTDAQTPNRLVKSNISYDFGMEMTIEKP